MPSFCVHVSTSQSMNWEDSSVKLTCENNTLGDNSQYIDYGLFQFLSTIPAQLEY